METIEEYDKKKEKGFVPKNVWKNLKPIHLIGFTILIFVLHKIISTSEEDQNNTGFIVVLGIIVAIYIISLFKQSEERGPIPRHIAQEIARRDLQRDIDANGSYPFGTKVIPMGYFKDQMHDNSDGKGPKLNKYNLSFEIKIPGRSNRYLRYQMNPYDGACKGIIEQTFGWKGEDVKDVQVIVPDRYFKEEEKPKG